MEILPTTSCNSQLLEPVVRLVYRLPKVNQHHSRESVFTSLFYWFTYEAFWCCLLSLLVFASVPLSQRRINFTVFGVPNWRSSWDPLVTHYLVWLSTFCPTLVLILSVLPFGRY